MLTAANGISSNGTSYAKVSCKQSKRITQKDRWDWWNFLIDAYEQLKWEKRMIFNNGISLLLHMMKVLAGKTEQCPYIKKQDLHIQAWFKRWSFRLIDSFRLCYLLGRPSSAIQCIFWFGRGCKETESRTQLCEIQPKPLNISSRSRHKTH